jgi:hypothetical protein
MLILIAVLLAVIIFQLHSIELTIQKKQHRGGEQ